MLASLKATVEAASPQAILLWAGILLALAAWGLYRFARDSFRARLIADTPTARVRSAPQGYVELIGRGRLLPGPPVLAPLTGLTCTWFHYRIERRQGSGRDRGWKVVEQGTSDALFRLQDDSGECIIDPEGAQVICVHTDRWHGSGPRPVGGPRTGGVLPGMGSYRYTERRLHPDEDLYAIGYFRTRSHDDGVDLASEVAGTLRAWKQDAERMAQLDTDGDGRISEAEWQAARQAAENKALVHRAERASLPVVHLMSRGPAARRPFILSALPEHLLISRHRRHALLGLAAFLGPGTFGVWLLLARFAP